MISLTDTFWNILLTMEFHGGGQSLTGFGGHMTVNLASFDNPTNYNDKKGFVTKFNVEAVAIGELVRIQPVGKFEVLLS
jgi:hypothetical protein